MENVFFDNCYKNEKMGTLIIEDVVKNRGSIVSNPTIANCIMLAMTTPFFLYMKAKGTTAETDDLQIRINKNLDSHGETIIFMTVNAPLGQKAIVALCQDFETSNSQKKLQDFLKGHYDIEAADFSNHWRCHNSVDYRRSKQVDKKFFLYTSYFVCDHANDIAGAIGLESVQEA